MYAEVDLITEQRDHVLAIPVEAIDGSGDATRVYTVDPSGAIQIVSVRLGVETAQRVEIRAGDLKEGDSVVVGSRAGLKAGAQVQPKVINLAGDTAPKQ
jgi:multidrug efflux pump subunit AcrA (membrane-fusion protein)